LLTLSFIKDIAVVIVKESTDSSVVLECHDEGVENAKISKYKVIKVIRTFFFQKSFIEMSKICCLQLFALIKVIIVELKESDDCLEVEQHNNEHKCKSERNQRIGDGFENVSECRESQQKFG
jgi:hypothetical protein